MKKIKKEKEINAILSLDGSRVYTMLALMVSCSIASWSKSTPQMVSCFIFFLLYFLQKDKREKEIIVINTPCRSMAEKITCGVSSEIETKMYLILKT
jgi:hypothetical protein